MHIPEETIKQVVETCPPEKDLMTAVAAKHFRKPYSAVTREERWAVKHACYMHLYNCKVFTLTPGASKKNKWVSRKNQLKPFS